MACDWVSPRKSSARASSALCNVLPKYSTWVSALMQTNSGVAMTVPTVQNIAPDNEIQNSDNSG